MKRKGLILAAACVFALIAVTGIVFSVNIRMNRTDHGTPTAADAAVLLSAGTESAEHGEEGEAELASALAFDTEPGKGAGAFDLSGNETPEPDNTAGAREPAQSPAKTPSAAGSDQSPAKAPSAAGSDQSPAKAPSAAGSAQSPSKAPSTAEAGASAPSPDIVREEASSDAPADSSRPAEPMPTPAETKPLPADPTLVETELPPAESEEPTASDAPSAMVKYKAHGLGYWLYTPENPSASMPLIVYLHGGSGKGNNPDTLLNIDGFPKWLYDGSMGSVPAYVLIPQLSSDRKGWSDAGESVIALIEEIAAEYGIDKDNISLTGHSMGGTGTFALAKAYPNVFARVAPCSGSIQITDDGLAAFQNMKVWVFAGTADTIVEPQSSIHFVDRMSEIGNAKLTLFEGATHFDVPALVYRNSEIDIIDWLIGS